MHYSLRSQYANHRNNLSISSYQLVYQYTYMNVAMVGYTLKQEGSVNMKTMLIIAAVVVFVSVWFNEMKDAQNNDK